MKTFVLLISLLSLSHLIQDQDIAPLLRQLDSQCRPEREKAKRALVQLGPQARDHIEAAARCGSPERVAQLRSVLQSIDWQIESLPAALEAILKEHAGSLHQLVRHTGKRVRLEGPNKSRDEVKRVLLEAGYRLLHQRDSQSGEEHYSEFTFLVKSSAWRTDKGISFDLHIYLRTDATIEADADTQHTATRAEARWIATIDRPLEEIRFPKGTVLQAVMESEEIIKEGVGGPILKEIDLRYALVREEPWRYSQTAKWQFELLPTLATSDGLQESRPFCLVDCGLDEVVHDSGAPGPPGWVSMDTLGTPRVSGGSRSDRSAGPWILCQPAWRAPWSGPKPLKFRAYCAADLRSVPPETHSLSIDLPALQEVDLEPLATLPKLSRVWLSCRGISVGKLERLAKIRTLTGLDLSPEKPMPDDAVRFLASMRLTYLHPSFNCDLDDADLETLSRNHDLRSVALSDWNSRFTDGGLDSLAKLPDLESLVLWHSTSITRTGMARLASLPKLRSLTIAYVGSFNDEALKTMSSSPGLESLDLINLDITDNGLKELCNLRSLKYLRVSQCRGITPDGMKRLGTTHPAKLEFSRQE